MSVDAGIFKGRVLVALELVNGIVHQFAVEDTKAYQQAEILERKTRDLTEESGFKLFDDVLQTIFPKVGEVHEYRDAGREFDELVLNFLALALELLLLFCQPLLFRG